MIVIDSTDFVWLILDLKESNVSSTKEILKLCRDTRSKVLHYVSTIGIFPASTQDNVTEKSIPDKCS